MNTKEQYKLVQDMTRLVELTLKARMLVRLLDGSSIGLRNSKYFHALDMCYNDLLTIMIDAQEAINWYVSKPEVPVVYTIKTNITFRDWSISSFVENLKKLKSWFNDIYTIVSKEEYRDIIYEDAPRFCKTCIDLIDNMIRDFESGNVKFIR